MRLPFQPQDTIQLREGGRLVVDLKRQHPKARFLGASRAGRVYLAAAKGKEMQIVAVGPQAETLWHRTLPGEQKSILFQVGTDGETMSDVVLLGYEDSSLKKHEGLLRQLLIDGSGSTIGDVSKLSYGSPQIGTDGKLIVLTGKRDLHCLEMRTGKTLWRKANASIVGTDPRNVLGYAITDARATALLIYLLVTKQKTEQTPGEAKLFAIDMKTGLALYEKLLDGVAWRMYASRNGTVWVVSPVGRGYRFDLRKSRPPPRRQNDS